MTPLGKRIAGLIEALGPISVSEYMALCLSDPDYGYYTTRQPFGRNGDFTTAPEISQMFGELVGVWLAAAWQALGRPADAMVVEIGPGRGTLMKDIARTVARIAPALRASASFHLVETSPRLRDVQATTLADSGSFAWHADIVELPDRPLFIVGNELFDALPVHQYVRTAKGWRERVVGLDDDDTLRFYAGAGSTELSLLPRDAETAPEGAVVEISPARAALMHKIADRIAARSGAGLFIDYGYAKPAVGDTLQALLKHAYDDPLAHPGEADLTAHVDFAALAQAARQTGLDAHLLTQGEFLLGMGLLERAGQLGAAADEAARERLSREVERLAGPQAMGNLFKVLAVLPAGGRVEPFPG
ncbi:MAG: class I SAM-dependent methyltransferase [Mesorhizobium sp.]|nr:class I SAM-dependent methyltransferase [Mesorhizobium sp.]MBN9243574.1 class I SAM-dependent methyltransferase [Mesorhizobium sp.]